MYPKNAATPPEVDLGQMLLISDGTIQTSGASVRVKIGTGAWGAGAGSASCDATSGIWTYAPTQAETNADYFIVGLYKASCTALSKTVITSASATAGYAGLDWSKVAAPTTTLDLTGTTIASTQKVDIETIKTQAVTCAAGVTVPSSIASPTNITAGTITTVTNVTTVNGLAAGVITAASIATNAIDADALAADAVTEIWAGSTAPAASAIADAVWDEVLSGHLSAGSTGEALNEVSTDTQSIAGDMTKLDSMLEVDGLVYRFTTNALEQGPAGAGGDPWDDALPGAYAAGTAGYILGNLSASTGSGARTVTITVNLSASPVEGALVRLTKAAETYLGTTNASGVVTFNIDDGTWTVAITAANATYAGTTIVVDGNETATYSMSAVSVTPSTPPARTGYLVCYDEDGAVEAGVNVTLTCYYAPDTGYALDSTAKTQVSSSAGLVEFSGLIVGAKYRIKRGEAAEYRFTVAAGSGSFAISSIVGDDE